MTGVDITPGAVCNANKKNFFAKLISVLESRCEMKRCDTIVNQRGTDTNHVRETGRDRARPSHRPRDTSEKDSHKGRRVLAEGMMLV
jgi:hypothetical protein